MKRDAVAIYEAISDSKGIRSGLWQTEGGSPLELIYSNGTLTGSYCSCHGQPQPDATFPIVGFVNGDLVAFACSWGPYKSGTSWSGRYGVENGRECKLREAFGVRASVLFASE
jgi:hypothetical protein